MPRLEDDPRTLPSARLAGSLPAGGWTLCDRPQVEGPCDAVDSQITEEELIVDGRSGISPAQLVEDKLTRILKDSSLPVSHLQMRGLLRSR